jgi:predicted nucleic acid-binding protein
LKAYVDSSVLLRVILGAPESLGEWPLITEMFCSVLLQVECMRTLERIGVAEGVAAELINFQRSVVTTVMSRARIAEFSPTLVRRAGYPMPMPLKTLDAIHLVTAMWWREQAGEIVFATHDVQLARAGRALDFHVLGA